MTETHIINERADSVKLIKGQRGSFGYEVKIHGELLSEEGLTKVLDKLKEVTSKLEESFSEST